METIKDIVEEMRNSSNDDTCPWWAFRKEIEDLWWEDLHLEFPDWLFAEAKGE